MGEMVVALPVALPLCIILDKKVPQTITNPCNVPGTGQV